MDAASSTKLVLFYSKAGSTEKQVILQSFYKQKKINTSQ